MKADWATYKAAKYACSNWHYSKCMPIGKIIKIGIWETDEKSCCEDFIGVILFSRGANKELGSPFGLNQTQICELTRVALRAHTANVSQMIAIALRMLKNTNPGLQLVVSFADTEQGHHGGIYQAGNWIYNGLTQSVDEYLYKGKRWHGRAFRKSHGSHLNYINQGLRIVKGAQKHRYLMPLNKKLKLSLDLNKMDYPKRTTKANSNDQLESGGAVPTSTLQTAARGGSPVR